MDNSWLNTREMFGYICALLIFWDWIRLKLADIFPYIVVGRYCRCYFVAVALVDVDVDVFSHTLTYIYLYCCCCFYFAFLFTIYVSIFCLVRWVVNSHRKGKDNNKTKQRNHNIAWQETNQNRISHTKYIYIYIYIVV